MTATQVGWLKVAGAGASGAIGVISTPDVITVRTVVIAILTFVVAAAVAASALYNASPSSAPPVTGLALLLGAALIAAGASGCGDDVQPFHRFAVCIDGREAWRAGAELYCYEPTGEPLTPRPWRPDETIDTACDYCEAFITPGGAP